MLEWLSKFDFALFALLSVGGGAAAHLWLRRFRHHSGVPFHAWAILLLMVAAAYPLANRSEKVQRQQFQRLVEGFAPTYAQELERMGHSKIRLDTPGDDPLYLSLIDAQIRWLKLNPAIADIYTYRKTPEGRLVMLVDAETDYDHNGVYEGDRELRTTIGEPYDTNLGPAIDQAWAGVPSFDEVISVDRWGEWISAYVPMRDETGKVEAVLGVDYPAADWGRSIRQARIDVLAIVFVLAAVWVGASTAISLLQTEVRNRRSAEADLAAHQADLEKVIAERSEALLNAQRQILQNEKLACVGQLAAGVAHEINTPVQYIGDNLRAISDSLQELLAVDKKYRELLDLLRAGRPTEQAVRDIEAAEREHEVEYLIHDTPQAISQSLEGVGRVTQIVRAMKDFSHLREEGFAAVNLNDLVRSTLTISRNEYKYVADLVTELGDLPLVECSAGEMGQALLNLIVNAAQAIGETGRRGTLTVRTRTAGANVEITVQDTGAGIPDEVRPRIFDAFFTTKPVGKGTGQGLSITQDILRRHGGTVDFTTEMGKGTTFTLCLPIQQATSPSIGVVAT